MNVLSLFSGIGAHDYGLEMAGLRIAGQVEIDPYCTAVLERHWPNVSRWTDVRDVRADDVVARCGRINLVTGGVPCQPASVAGKRQGAADSRWLWPEYLRLVVDLQPQWLLAENVPGFLSLGESDAVFAGLEAAGYEVWPLVVGAWAVGAPHKRDRVWIVGKLAKPKTERCERRGIAWRRGRGPANEGTGMADTSSEGSEAAQPVSAFGGVLRWPARPGEPQHEWEAPRLVANTVRKRRTSQHADGQPRTSEAGAVNAPSGIDGDGPVEPGLGGTTPGATRRLDSFARRNRLKALGNANPPHVPCLIGRWLMSMAS